MMLRSSSTPVLGSLLPSISPENPNNHRDTTTHKFSLTPASQHFTTLSCTSSPISPSFSNGGIRRAQSEGNLESLMNSAGGGGGDDEFSFFNPSKKFSSRIHSPLLETIPSFSFQNSTFKSDDEDSGDDEEPAAEGGGAFGEFCGFKLNKHLGFENFESRSMYLAKGIGVDVGFGGGDGGGGGRNLSQVGHGGGGGGGGDGHGAEEHYRKMVNENPGNPLFLRNYAEFLYQLKKDLEGAEEYYSRAILVDPNDGEILSQYAKILWELHHDNDRAKGYFERAVQAASEDSHVHAAYASFLWEIEEDEDEDEDEEGYYSNITPVFNNGTMASATA